MATTFCSDKDLTNVGHGFVMTDEGVKTNEIEDKIGRVVYHVRNKMGSSIPTIFARLFLFGSAYIDVNADQNDQNNNNPKAHLGKRADNGNMEPTVYNHLISEHLDMLEFLFRHGSELKIVKWGKEKIRKLTTPANQFETTREDWKQLGIAINNAIQKTPNLKDLQHIHIFLYNGRIVGGTSPLSVVFTNPNWANIMEENGYRFEDLFSKSVRALHERALTFRLLLYMQYKRGDYNNDYLKDFGTYIRDSFQSYDKDLREKWEFIENQHDNQAINSWIDGEISNLADELKDERNLQVKTSVSVVQIYKEKPFPTAESMKASQYIIKPSTDEAVWKREEVDGRVDDLPVAPYLLPPYGIDGAVYFDKKKWDNASHHVPAYAAIKDVPLSQRELPGTGQKVPFITEDDLFEDKMVEMAFVIDNKRFFTGSQGNMRYLLPLKKELFRFYTIESLKDMLTIDIKDDDDDTMVTVTLNIPMEYWRNPISLSRTYTSKRDNNEPHLFPIVDCHQSKDAFNLGFFPFFRVDNMTNVFDIMVGQTSKQVNVAFYKVGNLTVPVSVSAEGKRVEANEINTRHILVKDTFDIVELSVGEGRGLVLPLMSIVNGGTKNFVFAVDFGTTNTHIAWADCNNLTDMQPLTIEEQDVQVVFLHDIKKSNTFTRFNQEAQRELPPRMLVTDDMLDKRYERNDLDSNKESEKRVLDKLVKLPMRTVIYERNDLDNNKESNELFCHLNIGFNFQKEVKKSFSNNDYKTDLKWEDMKDGLLSEARITKYFIELLWILRNKAILNGGNNDFRLIITYPQAMRTSQLGRIQDAWKTAQKQLNFGRAIDKNNYKVESVAPYMRLRTIAGRDGVAGNDIFVNIDIGGGSTDILYVNPNNEQWKSYSVFFAAKDLWGVGNDPAHKQQKQNGFTLAYSRGASQDEQKNFKDYLDVAYDASDVVSHLFAQHNDLFKSRIQSSGVGSVVITHFAALMYYLALIIKNDNLATPHVISFTGMGSKYIDIISTNPEVIPAIINQVLKSAGINNPNVRISRERNPKEVTAEGAVLMANAKVDYNLVQHTIYGVKDEDDENFTGRDVQSTKVKQRTIDEVKSFIEMLNTIEFKDAVSNTYLKFDFQKLINCGLGDSQMLEGSYKNMSDELQRNDPDSRISDALFFWPLKDTLFNVAFTIAETENNKKQEP